MLIHVQTDGLQRAPETLLLGRDGVGTGSQRRRRVLPRLARREGDGRARLVVLDHDSCASNRSPEASTQVPTIAPFSPCAKRAQGESAVRQSAKIILLVESSISLPFQLLRARRRKDFSTRRAKGSKGQSRLKVILPVLVP